MPYESSSVPRILNQNSEHASDYTAFLRGVKGCSGKSPKKGANHARI